MKKNSLSRMARMAIIFFSFTYMNVVMGETFPLPAHNQELLGRVDYVTSSSGDSLLNIGQRNNVGFNQMAVTNPGVNPMMELPLGTTVKVPASFLLPSATRSGVLINLPEMRMYYFPPGTNTVMVYPIGIGRIGKTIPIAHTAVSRKTTNPTWRPPEDIREFNREQGIELPEVMTPGPDNPLGPYAVYLRIPTYLIHSTIFPESIGRRASFGCIRMHETDIKEFYPLAQPGMKVTIIDMPTKVGWQNDKLLLETHEPLEERNNLYATHYGVTTLVNDAVPKHQVVLIDWELVSYLTDNRDGVPREVGFKVNS